MLLRRSPLLLVIGLVFISCLPGAHAPSSASAGPLGLAEELPERATHRPFAVVFGGPKGETDDTSQVSLMFNRPMRPLEMAGAEAPSPAKITTAEGAVPEGAWHWLGTSALVFSPKGELPRATEYVVTVPQGVAALDGSKLEAPYVLRFSTARPHVIAAEPDEDQRLAPSATFAVTFDQSIDPVELGKHIALRANDVDTSARVERIEGSKTHFRIKPTSPLPLDAAITVAIDNQLRGVAGPLPMKTPHSITNRTYGPLVVEAADCSHNGPHNQCLSGSGVWVRFSNSVSAAEIARHARIDGAGAVTSYYGESEHHALRANLQPGRSYKLVITAGIKDAFGQRLAKDYTLPFTTDDEWPALELGLQGEVLEAGGGAGTKGPALEIPVTEVNVPSYRVVTAPLDEASAARFWLGSTQSFARASMLPGAHVTTVATGSAKNVQATRNITVSPTLAAQGGRGALVFGAAFVDGSSSPHEEVRLVQVTDLAVSAKMSAFGSTVWVTHLHDGRPAVGATVVVRDKTGAVIASAQADGNGIATIPASQYAPKETAMDDVLVARLGSDWTIKRVTDRIYSWDPALDLSGELHAFGIVFTERGIYRPGETIHMKALVRKELSRGTSTPAGKAFTVVAADARGQELLRRVVTLGSFGDLALDIPIPRTAPLGDVRIEVTGESSTISTMATVAEYRPAEFKVTVAPERPAYVRGDALHVTSRGDYLFGAPMSGGKASVIVTRGPGHFVVPGHETFIVSDEVYTSDLPDTSLRASEIQSIHGALGAEGDLASVIPLALPAQRGTEVINIESTIEDLNRQTVSSSASVIVHPGELYIGIERLGDGFVRAGAKITPHIVAVTPDGHRRDNVAVHVQLLARTWQSVLRATGAVGATYDSHAVDTEIASCDVVTGTAPQSCDLATGKGAYYIVRARAKDARGNAVGASTYVYALGDEASAYGWPMSSGRKLDLVADKKSYAVGDTAQVLVKNPWPGAEALVTVERAGVYTQQRQVLRGSMPTLQIPITSDMRPNAYVAVHVVRARSSDAPAAGSVDAGAPSYRTGEAELRIEPESRRLAVKITPAKKDYRPGEMVDADVTVTDRAGKPVRTELTFYAVDEGVLMLTGYRTPDPISAFTRSRPLAVFTLESRDELARLLKVRLGSGGEDKGLDGGGGSSGNVREDFRTSAYFEPHLVAEGGKAHVHFKLPDSLTTYRLMAVAAAEDDRFGSAETQITSSRKLMARPALPRFLRAGDAFSAGIIVSTKGLQASSVNAELDVHGLVLEGDAKRTVTIPASGSVEVRWKMRAERVGDASFTFKVSGGGETDAVRVERHVAVPTVVESVALYGETQDAVAEKLGQLDGMRDDYGGLDVRLATSALVGLEDGFDHLVEYPYGCTEQLTSRVVPLLLVRDFAKEFGIVLPKDIDAKLDEAIAKIVANQLSNGSFGYWPSSERGYPWLTAYALWGMTVAKEGGHAVPSDTIDAARRYLRSYLAGGGSRTRDGGDLHEHELGLAEMAFVLDVLSMTGTPDPGYMNQLYAERGRLPIFARATLAHAMTLGKMDHTQTSDLFRDLENHLRATARGALVTERSGDAYASLLDSETRTTAIVLRALIAYDRKNPLTAKLARGLLDQRKGGTWRSTQETAWALLALHDFHKVAESESPEFDAKIFFGNALVSSTSFRDRSLRATSLHLEHAFESSGAGVSFQVSGTGKLYYEAHLKYARRTLPMTPLDRGFFVKKTVSVFRANDSAMPDVSLARVKGGDVIAIDLTVTTPDPREQVVIEDPLPAGLEAIDTSLATAAKSLEDAGAGAGSGGDDDSTSAWTRSWYRREIRDDRVLTFLEHMPAGIYHYRYLARATTFGTFVVPPTKAECMYEPETFGRTSASILEVAQ